MDTRNPVADAIDKLGGLTGATVAFWNAGMKTAASTLYRWKQAGKISDAQAAILMAELTGIDVRILAGYDRLTPPPFPTGTDPDEAPLASRRRLLAPSSKADPEKPPQAAPAVASADRPRKKKAWSRSRRWRTQALRSSVPVVWPDFSHLPATGTDGP